MTPDEMAQILGMDVIEFPCERCGEVVPLLSKSWGRDGQTLMAEGWANGSLVVFCLPCGLIEVPGVAA